MQKQKLNKLFESHYEELEETRNSSNTEGLRKIAELGNSGQYKETIKEAKLLLKKYPDLDYLYLWLGISYFGLDDYKNAHSILIEGLNKSKSKAYLCNQLGEIEWKLNNAKEALKWWCQAIRCHESNPHDLDNSPYLCLGAVAGAFGLKKEYDIFMRRAKSIRDATLSPEAFSDIQNLFIQQKTNEMHDIIKGIVKLVG